MNCVESCWVEVSCKNKSKMIVGCIYRHPRANIPEFTNEMKDILTKLNHEKYQVFIVGDINIDFLKYNIHDPTEEYLDMIHSLNFLPLITKPTRITNHSRTLIDHIYTNSYSDNITSGIATFDISDHLPIFCMINTEVNKDKENIMYRDFTNFDHKSYLKELNNINWNQIIELSTDLHEATANTINMITSIVNKYAPVKILSRKKEKLHLKPWISNGLFRSIKTKQKMFYTHFHSNDLNKANEYKKYSNKLNRLLKQAKSQYFNKRFEQCKDNLKFTWKLIGTLIKRKTKSQLPISKIMRNNRTYTRRIDIANQLNEHFINVGPNLAKQIPSTTICPTDYITNSPTTSFMMSPVSVNEVTNLFKSLDDNKSSIGVPNKLIKIAAKQLAMPFTYIYNESFESGIVPNPLKISRVTPVFKSDSPIDPNNYRPVATLSSFSKILEKIVYNRLLSFLNKNKILYKYQFGFRKGHSTEQAILEITDTLKSNIDKRLITCGLFLDFSKAFDTVDHEILLMKLNKYGIRGIPHSWFTSYLTNRKQYVKIKEVESDLQTIKCGVPQGSTLGPLLFLLYINDMANSSKKLSFRIFADDTNIFCSANEANDLENTINTELKLVLQYCAVNKLSVNMKKTHYMIITTRKCRPQIHIPNIAQKEYIKYLGVYIDDKISWIYQIKHINSKIAKNIGIINKLRHYLSLKMLRQLYFNLIYPFLNYAIMSWANTYKSRLSKIVTKQNKAIRSIFFANSRETADPYYGLLQILKFYDIFKLKVASLIYKIINNSSKVPEPFQDVLVLASEVHGYNTRFASKKNLIRTATRTNYGAHTFKSISSQIWETIPDHIKNCKSISIFKDVYKEFLLKTSR